MEYGTEKVENGLGLAVTAKGLEVASDFVFLPVRTKNDDALYLEGFEAANILFRLPVGGRSEILVLNSEYRFLLI